MSRFRYVKQHLDVAHHARFQDFLKSSVHTTTHGSSALATQCGRSTSPHAPKEHGTRPTTTWAGYAAEETMHSTAQPRQHASDRGQQAQRTHRPTTPTLANDGRTDTHKLAAMGPGPPQHAEHAGHQPRAAQTQNPRPPAHCRQASPPRSSQLLDARRGPCSSSREWRSG